MTYDLNKMRKSMEHELDERRYNHTVGVAYTAGSLAAIYGEDVEKAMAAGFLHDSAKCMTNKKRIEICNKNKIPISEIEYRNPFLLHAKVGRFIAHEKFGIDDEDILNAIEFHTTGRPGMSTLEKIVYISDYIEPHRNQATNLLAIRKSAYTDLDKTVVMILKDTLSYLESAGNEIDSLTQETYEYYKKTAEYC